MKAGGNSTPIGGLQAKFQLALSVSVGLLSFKGAMAASDGAVKEGLLEEVTGELSSEQ